MNDIKIEYNDLVLPDLKLPDPCPIKVEFRDNQVFLCVGQRDWQWHADGRFIGCSTDVSESGMEMPPEGPPTVIPS